MPKILRDLAYVYTCTYLHIQIQIHKHIRAPTCCKAQLGPVRVLLAAGFLLGPAFQRGTRDRLPESPIPLNLRIRNNIP